MNQPQDDNDSPPASGAATIVEDLILTDAFLIKGRVRQKASRLSKLLESSDREFITMSDAWMIELKQGEQIRTPRVSVNINQIVMAHELVDAGGDFYQKNIAVDDKSVRIRAFYVGATNLEVAGRVSPHAYESRAGGRKFFVMDKPSIRGIDPGENSELEILHKLPYVILSKERLAYLYDFSV